MEFRILGPLEVLELDVAQPLGAAKQRAVLAILILHRGELVSADRLADELWGERPPATAAKTLQGYISRLRKTLGDDLLRTQGHGYVLMLPSGVLDLEQFERLAGEGRAALSDGDTPTAAERLHGALALWRGPPLADFTYEPFAQAEIARLEESRLASLEDRIDADLGLGRQDQLVGELERLVREYPGRERLRGQLMLALYRAGRQADALECYRIGRRAMIDELGIEPGRALQELQAAILGQDSSLDVERPVAPTRRVTSQKHATLAAPGAQPSAASFVGRDRELDEFVTVLGEAVAGRASVLLIAGEAGIGKSRLADEMTTLAESRGAKVLWGRCWEAGGAPAYWPWVQALRAYVQDTDVERVRRELGAGAGDVAQMVPFLHELIPDLPATPSLDPEGARFRLFDSTMSFLRLAAEAQPLILVLDDMHAADTPSLLLLRFLVQGLRDARIVLLVAYRDTEAEARTALSAGVADLRRGRTTRLVQLGGFAVHEVAHLVEQTTGTEPSAGLVAAIHRETEGNPLFVGELVRLLATEQRLEDVASRGWTAALPSGVREVIGHRLKHLSRECKELLSVASVLGREFRFDVLEQLSDRPREQVFDLVDEAVAARVVGDLPTGRGGMRFSHALIRDSLYEDLGTGRRVQLHRRAADALMTLYGPDPEPYLAEVAHHLLEAAPGGDAERAIDYARRAGDHAVDLLAYEEAARLYEMALEAVELSAPPDEPTRCDLLLASGDARARGGDLSRAKESFDRAAQIARNLRLPVQLGRAALGYGGRFVWFRAGNDHRLIPLLEEALALSGDSPLRARLLARLAGALRDDPAPERREALSGEAVELARQHRDVATLAYALEGTYAALSLPRDTDRWLAMAHELIDLAGEIGDKEQAFSGHLHAFGGFTISGELRSADTEFTTLIGLAAELRQPAQLWALAMTQTMRAAFAGRFEEADQHFRRAQRGVGVSGTLGGVDETTFSYVAHLLNWSLHRERGGLAEIHEPIRDFAAEYPTFFMFQCLLANLYSQLGDKSQAHAQLSRVAADGFASLGVGTEWFAAASLLAEPCAFLGEARYAARLYDALLPYADYNVMSQPEFCLGSASRYLGILAATMSRSERAARHFERALELNAIAGALPALAHTQHDYACTLLARGTVDDTRLARELLDRAVATYDDLGMQPWLDKASGLAQARL
jgi:DNA-binding SARP family transcriptional activator